MNNKIIRLQSRWRGYITREKLLNTRTEYEAIFNEIENCDRENNNIIKWPNKYLCSPIFTVKERENLEDVTFDPDSLEDINRHSRKNDQLDNISEVATPTICTSCSNSQPSVVNCSCTREGNEDAVELISKNIQTDPPFCDISCQTSLCFEQNNDLVSSTPRTNIELVNPPVQTDMSSTFGINTNHIDNLDKQKSPGSTTDRTLPPPIIPAQDVSFEMDLTNSSAKELYIMKEELSLELLWLNQAITSRKTYLTMKQSTS